MGGGEARAPPQNKRLLRGPPSPDLFECRDKDWHERMTVIFSKADSPHMVKQQPDRLA
ncbi:MAG: hypothetical protein RL186_911 [Pseudomonadota bacterium]|jgi:hypothetical protein